MSPIEGASPMTAEVWLVLGKKKMAGGARPPPRFILPKPERERNQDRPGVEGRSAQSGGLPHTPYYLRGVSKERAPGDQHGITLNAHPTAPWPMGPGWGVSGDDLSATSMPRLCVYGR